MPLPSPLVDEDFLYNGKAPPALVELGRNLFFDPVLSGNQNISCGACHDPRFGTGDGLALGIGEGGSGAGSERRTEEAVTGRVPRNAPALWNLGAIEVTAMFHDGRLERMADNPPRYRVPAGGEDAKEAASLLAAQAFFPVSSPIEMAGQRGENVVADAVVEGRLVDARELLADRVSQIDAYLTLLEVAFNDVNGADDVRYLHIAEALAAFQADTFRSDNSPFDSVLRTGDRQHLSADAQAGIDLFYGTAGCAACHSGPLLTDHDFHAIAVPQIGPGKGHGFDKGYWQTSGHMAYLEDEGRYQVTGDRDDIFAFRTPSLRNVAQSGPWGHSGAFQDLEDMVRHHLDATASLANFDATLVPLPQLHSVSEQVGPASATGYDLLSAERKGDFDMRDAWVQASVSTRSRIAEANDLAPVQLSETEIKQIMAFLEALTDPEALERGSTVPKQVPSGLPPQPQR
ncbi:MAG: cytochrome c peroxidase [Pseudomonadota bacterium]